MAPSNLGLPDVQSQCSDTAIEESQITESDTPVTIENVTVAVPQVVRMYEIAKGNRHHNYKHRISEEDASKCTPFYTVDPEEHAMIQKYMNQQPWILRQGAAFWVGFYRWVVRYVSRPASIPALHQILHRFPLDAKLFIMLLQRYGDYCTTTSRTNLLSSLFQVDPKEANNKSALHRLMVALMTTVFAEVYSSEQRERLYHLAKRSMLRDMIRRSSCAPASGTSLSVQFVGDHERDLSKWLETGKSIGWLVDGLFNSSDQLKPIEEIGKVGLRHGTPRASENLSSEAFAEADERMTRRRRRKWSKKKKARRTPFTAQNEKELCEAATRLKI